MAFLATTRPADEKRSASRPVWRQAMLGQPTPRTTARVIASITGLAAVLVLAQQLFGGHLTGINEYDDGVYYLSSVQLLHANLPYRDFAFIQPPGILVSLLPFAYVGQHLSEATGLLAARLFFVALGVANVALVGLLLRRRSTLSVLAGMAVATLYPEAIRATQTVLLEPLLVFFCLVALLVVFEGERFSESSRRWRWSGVLLGVAISVKIWAVIPMLALFVVARRVPVRLLLRGTSGAIAGALAICIAFLALAPRAFIHDVVVTQFVRNPGGSPLAVRVADLSGIPGLGHYVSDHHRLGIGIDWLLAVLVVAGLAAAYRRTRSQTPTKLEEFALVAAVLVVGALLVAPTYYYHYGEFAAPFLALAASGVVQRVSIPRLHLAVGLAVVGLAGALLVSDAHSIIDQQPSRQVTDVISDAIPISGCVFTDNPSVLILDNVVTADRPGCPNVVDWAAAQRVIVGGVSQSRYDAGVDPVQDQILNWLEDSQTVVIHLAHPDWGKSVTAYLRSNFEQVDGVPGWLTIYQRDHLDLAKG